MIPRRLLVLARLVPGPILWSAFAILVVTATYVATALATAAAMARLAAGDGAGAALWLGVAGVTIAVRGVAIPWRAAVTAGAGLAVRRKVRATLLRHLADLGPAWATGTRSGTVQATIVDGVDGLDPYFSLYLPQLAVTAVASTALAGAVFAVHPAAGIVVTVCLVVAFVVPRFKDAALVRAGRERWDAYLDLSADYLESMQGLPVLRSLGAAERRRDALERRTVGLYRTTMRQLRVSLLENGVTTGVTLAGTVAAVALAAGSVARGEAAMVVVFLVLMLSIEAFRPIRDLAKAWHAGYLGITAVDGVDEILSATPEVVDAGSGDIPVGDGPPELALEAVSYRYPGAATDALEGVSLRIPGGSVVAVVGRSGAGKSTLAALIGRDREPDGGRITINGTDVRELRLDAVRDAVAVVAQRTHLFHGTLRDNLRLGATAATDAELTDALGRAGAGFALDLPGGLEHPIGEGGDGLSGGQRQRLAVARALARRTPILVLDEPTAHVDADTDRRILDAVAALRGRVTCVVIAHRLDALDIADAVVVMEAGRIVESGTVPELLAADGAFAELWRRSRERDPGVHETGGRHTREAGGRANAACANDARESAGHDADAPARRAADTGTPSPGEVVAR